MTDKLIQELTIPSSTEGAEQLASLLEGYDEAKIVLESTGNLWIRLYNTLNHRALTFKVILANPNKTRIIAEAKIKNDRMDARVLADLVRADLVAESYVPTKPIREQRALLRQRRSLVENTVAVKNRIHNQLDKYDPQPHYSDLFGKQGHEWLRNLQHPPTERTILDVNLKQLQSLEESIQTLTIRIAQEAINRPNVKLLMGFTGIDYYSAMLLINEIRPIARFASPKKLVSYAGLAPNTHQSGDRTMHGPITKEGNSHVRWILVEAAQHAARHDPRLNQFYLRVMKRRGDNRAIVAVARKLLVTIYYVLNHHQEYRGLRPELYTNKIKRLQRITESSLQTA